MALCTLCRSETDTWKVIKHVPVEECPACGHRQADVPVDDTHTSSVYGDAYFTGGGSGYVDYLAEGPMLIKRGKKYARILSRHLPPGRVLDIGSAAGFILEGLISHGWSGSGVEPNDLMASAARSRGIDVSTGIFDAAFADKLCSNLAANHEPKFDAICLIQVIAHLQDPAETFELVSRLLRPGGVVLVETWDRNSRAARLAKEGWHEYSPPSILHWFTKPELNSLAARHRLSRIDGGFMPKWITAEHAGSLLRHGRDDAPPLTAKITGLLPKRLALPYPGDDLFWVLYQSGAQ